MGLPTKNQERYMNKNICEVCKNEKISMISKIPFLFGLTVHCGHCRTTYKQDKIRVFEDGFFIVNFFVRLFGFILEVLYVPLLVLLVVAFMYSIEYAILLSIIIIVLVLLFLNFVPYRIDETDGVNKIIGRIQKKKHNK